MDRQRVLISLDKFRKDLAHDPIFEDLSNYAPELQFLINEFKRLEAAEAAARKEHQKEFESHNATKKSYAQTANKLKGFKRRMSLIRSISESKNPSIKDIRYLANGYEMREEK